MAKMIDVTDSTGHKFYVNIDLCISMSRDTFNDETKLLFSGIVFGVKETPDEIVRMANPN